MEPIGIIIYRGGRGGDLGEGGVGRAVGENSEENSPGDEGGNEIKGKFG